MTKKKKEIGHSKKVKKFIIFILYKILYGIFVLF